MEEPAAFLGSPAAKSRGVGFGGGMCDESRELTLSRGPAASR